MDKTFLTPDDKTQVLKAGDTDNGIRNIGDLPESILEHILSFLPMRDAVRTSVLSKRWEFLWQSIPKLEFIERSYYDRKLFMNSVDRVLLLHDRCPLKNFHLDCKILFSASQVNTWITTVVRRHVEKCTLRLTDSRELFRLPHCLFRCETLVFLDLNMPWVLFLPSQIHLPNLRVLSLKNIMFLDECSIEQLISSPNIESLSISNCSWVHLTALRISCPKLKHLRIEGDFYDETLDSYFPVMICDCNLKSFKLAGPMFNEYLVCNLSADDVCICFEYNDWVLDRAMHRLKNILLEIHAVRTLSFQRSTFCLLEDTPEWTFDWSDFPNFSALNKLEVHNLNGKIGALAKILQHSPNLQILSVHVGLDYSFHGEDDKVFDEVPLCFSSSIKFINVGVSLTDGELHVLKAMLKHGAVLEQILIFSHIRNDYVKLENFNRKLMHCPRASRNCNIILC